MDSLFHPVTLAIAWVWGWAQLNLSFFLSPQHSGNSFPHPSLYRPKKEKIKLYITPHTSWNSSAERILYCPKPCTCHLIPMSLGREYLKVICSHPAYLTYIQTASCEMLDWMSHKVESKLPGEIPITSNMQIWGTKERSWWGWKRRVKKLA